MSPGLIRSGLYPTKKSLFNFKLEFFSSICFANNFVVPGYTVDSITTKSPFFKNFEIVFIDFLKNFKSGNLFLINGVGTVTIKKLHFFKSLLFFVMTELF